MEAPSPGVPAVPALTCSMSSHSSRPTKMSSRGSRWRVPLLLTRNQEVTLILVTVEPVWPWGGRSRQSRLPVRARPRALDSQGPSNFTAPLPQPLVETLGSSHTRPPAPPKCVFPHGPLPS